jgi:DNA-binding CsgD family transcriptional regulator
MIRYALIYGLGLAVIAILLEWLGYRHAMRVHSTEFYVVCVALVFAALGIWVGNRLKPVVRRGDFALNAAAIESLGISAREREVLVLIAQGHSNKLIARRLDISPNTVKTHVTHLYEKLAVASRTQAVQKARLLEIIP